MRAKLLVALRPTTLLSILLVAPIACGDDGVDDSPTAGSGPGGGGSSAGGGPAGGGGAATDGGGPEGGAGGGVVQTDCTDQCRYVSASATGDGSGSDWQNAATALPADLVRGLVYFVASGSYGPYTFDDAASGSETITILRATESDHGTDTGWDAALASGSADFGPLVIASPYVELDGRGATRIVGTFESTVVDISAPNVTFRGTDVDGNFQESGGQQTDGACTGMSVSADDVVVANNRIHDAADDGVSITGASGVLFEGNVVHALHGCGTDGGCGPCYNGHSDGLEIYDLKSSDFVGNLIYDVASTSAFFFGNWADELGDGPSEYCEDIVLVNNLLYNPQTGFVAYIEDAIGVYAYNNVFWGLHQGAYGGLSIGQNVAALELYNNAILSINYAHIGGSYDPAEHHGDYNLFGLSLGQWQDSSHDVVAADAGFAGLPDIDGAEVTDPSPDDFAPTADSPLIDAGFGGDEDIPIPGTDFFGAERDQTPNIGAIE